VSPPVVPSPAVLSPASLAPVLSPAAVLDPGPLLDPGAEGSSVFAALALPVSPALSVAVPVGTAVVTATVVPASVALASVVPVPVPPPVTSLPFSPHVNTVMPSSKQKVFMPAVYAGPARLAPVPKTR